MKRTHSLNNNVRIWWFNNLYSDHYIWVLPGHSKFCKQSFILIYGVKYRLSHKSFCQKSFTVVNNGPSPLLRQYFVYTLYLVSSTYDLRKLFFLALLLQSNWKNFGSKGFYINWHPVKVTLCKLYEPWLKLFTWFSKLYLLVRFELV